MKINIFHITILYEAEYNIIFVIDSNTHTILTEHAYDSEITLNQWMSIVNRYCILFNHPLIYS